MEMMNPCRSLTLVTALGFACATGHAAVESLTFRNSPQKDIVPPSNVVDGSWIIVGGPESAGGRVVRDTEQPYKGQPVYRFSATNHAVNRIEFCEIWGCEENLKSLAPAAVDRAVTVGCAYLNADVGQYGDTVTYEWSTRFPKPLTPESIGIFAQWHGRPDRTLIHDGKSLRLLSGAEMVELLKTIEFKESGWGHDRRSGEQTSIRVDGGAGGPIGAFLIKDSYMYLIVRSDASRLSTGDERQKPNPAREIGQHIQEGPKEAALVWKMPLAQVPINQWMDFKVRIHYSEYAPDADVALTSGSVAVWLNGEQVADWKGNVGKNDIQGPYFKFGIYKPSDNGFHVDHAAYRRTIERTRTSQLIRDPVRE